MKTLLGKQAFGDVGVCVCVCARESKIEREDTQALWWKRAIVFI